MCTLHACATKIHQQQLGSTGAIAAAAAAPAAEWRLCTASPRSGHLTTVTVWTHSRGSLSGRTVLRTRCCNGLRARLAGLVWPERKVYCSRLLLLCVHTQHIGAHCLNMQRNNRQRRHIGVHVALDARGGLVVVGLVVLSGCLLHSRCLCVSKPWHAAGRV